MHSMATHEFVLFWGVYREVVDHNGRIVYLLDWRTIKGGTHMAPTNELQIDSSFRAKVRAMGSIIRFGILRVLRDGPLPVVEIAKRVGLSQPSCSNHVNILWKAGLLKRSKRGRYIYYGIDTEALNRYFSQARLHLGLDQ